MFTGLIEDVGRVVKLEQRGSAASLTVTTALPAEGFLLGDSVAVNGVCLTVVAMKGNALSFDVSPETLTKSSVGRVTPGAKVNLERALCLSDRLGGHIVTGHIDCVATVAGRREESGNIIFDFQLPEENARYLVPKGSVAIDGISLTVNNVSSSGFNVNIIPHTAAMTTLHLCRQGDVVNIETDIIGKYVGRLLERGRNGQEKGVSLELLAKNGFL